MRDFTEKHRRIVGYVTNQPDVYDSSRPHASVAVCDRPECIDTAERWVAFKTKETPHFVRYPKNSGSART